MTLTEWPNKLGFDAGDVEIWKHAEAFGVRAPDRVLRVPYAVTTNLADRGLSVPGARSPGLRARGSRPAGSRSPVLRTRPGSEGALLR
jgi:hypothetical protein